MMRHSAARDGFLRSATEGLVCCVLEVGDGAEWLRGASSRSAVEGSGRGRVLEVRGGREAAARRRGRGRRGAAVRRSVDVGDGWEGLRRVLLLEVGDRGEWLCAPRPPPQVGDRGEGRGGEGSGCAQRPPPRGRRWRGFAARQVLEVRDGGVWRRRASGGDSPGEAGREGKRSGAARRGGHAWRERLPIY